MDKILPSGLDHCLVYAARYAHSRNTGAALQVVNEIDRNWHDLAPSTKKRLIREAKNEARYNKEDWARLIKMGE